MRLHEVLSPTNGLFSNMPQTIWGASLDPSLIDIELFTRIGKLETSPLVDYYTVGGVLDTEQLARLLYQRYGSNWQRIWDALVVEYDIMITSTTDETRSIARDTTGTETRDLTDTQTGTVGDETSTDGSTTRTGSISRSGNSQVVKDLTDLETRNLTGTNLETGTEGVTDTYDETTDRDSTLTYSGSEKITRSEDETTSGDSTLTYSGTETKSGSTDETRDLEKKNTGTVADAGTETQTGNGTTTGDHGKYGVGGAGLANESRDVNSETRNYTNGKTNTRTDNTTEAETGIVGVDTSEVTSFTGRNDKTVETGSRDVSGDETKTFTGRNDSTAETESHTGTVERETAFGKQTATTDAGTLTNKLTGTEGTSDVSTETFNSLKDTQSGTETKTETRDLTDKRTGTIGNVGNENVQETLHSEGSSPLRTFQALITEEINGRSGQAWNFTDLVIKDVQAMITSKIWRRTHG